MEVDKTSEEVSNETPEISDQDTLDAALTPEPVEEEKEPEVSPEAKAEDTLVWGKYKSMEEAEKAHKEMQARSTRSEQELKELKKQVKDHQKQQLKGLDYDKQMDYLLEQQAALEETLAAQQQVGNQSDAAFMAAAAQQEITDYISTKPLLKDSGFEQEFYLAASHPDMQEIKLDEIYNKLFKPKLEKWSGTKITVKEKPLRGTSLTPKPDADLQNLSPQEYEKNRMEILRQAGVQV